MQLTNKVALVTGAGSGIAKATAKLFAKEGAKVAALGRTKEELEETVAEIESDNGEAIPLIADISQTRGNYSTTDRRIICKCASTGATSTGKDYTPL